MSMPPSAPAATADTDVRDGRMNSTDHRHMAHALRLARRGLYTTRPNPRVGCVIVRDDEIVGAAWHQRAGEAHAEVLALQEAGKRARGAIAYVTLEPCCHTGRTPPCTEALLQAGVRRVVVAMTDPNPLVAGKGMEQLVQAGIQVEAGVLQAQAEALNRGFIMRMTQQRPFVRGKFAMSVDGRTALANGQSQWITGVEARADVQRLRAESGAIMTGIGTVLSDDPSLTVRMEQLNHHEDAPVSVPPPLRVVLDSQLRMPAQARLLNLPGHTLVFTASTDTRRKAEILRAGVDVVTLAGQAQRVDPHAVLHYLAAEHEVNDVLLEAGPTLSGALLQAGLIDELVIYMAPKLLGDGARGLFDFMPQLTDLQQALEIGITDLRAVGRDWRITAKVVKQ